MDSKRNRKLRDLKNIGRKLSERLNGIGIQSEADLRKVGAVEAHRMLKVKHPAETLPLCYYLYSFDGALSDKHWNDIGEKRKRELTYNVRQPRTL